MNVFDFHLRIVNLTPSWPCRDLSDYLPIKTIQLFYSSFCLLIYQRTGKTLCR